MCGYSRHLSRCADTFSVLQMHAFAKGHCYKKYIKMNQYNCMQDKNKIQKHEKLKRDEKCDLSFYGIGRVGSSNYVTNTETSNECKHVYYNMYVNAFCEKKIFHRKIP